MSDEATARSGRLCFAHFGLWVEQPDLVGYARVHSARGNGFCFGGGLLSVLAPSQSALADCPPPTQSLARHCARFCPASQPGAERPSRPCCKKAEALRSSALADRDDGD